MSTVLHATSRGQVTLPKKWREKYETEYFVTEEVDGFLIVRPLLTDSFKKSVESSWKEYKEGKHTSLEEVAKQYGL